MFSTKSSSLQLFLILISLSLSHAQDIKPKYGDEIETEGKLRYITFYMDNDSYIIGKEQKKGRVHYLELKEYDKEGNNINTYKLNKKIENKSLTYHEIVKTTSGLFAIGNRLVKRDYEHYKCKLEITETILEPELILKDPFKYDAGGVSMSPGRNDDVIGTKVSEDMTKVLITDTYGYQPHKGKELYSMYVLNEELELLWKKDLTTDSPDYLYDIDHYNVSNEGAVVIHAKQWSSNTSKNRASSVYKEFIHIFNDENEAKEAVVLGSQVSVTSTTFFKDNHLFVTGYYVNKSDVKKIIKGVYIAKYTTTGELIWLEKNNFDKIVPTVNLNTGFSVSVKLLDLKMFYSAFTKDDEVYLVGQKSLLVEPKVANHESSLPQMKFFLGEIVYSKLNLENGALEFYSNLGNPTRYQFDAFQLGYNDETAYVLIQTRLEKKELKEMGVVPKVLTAELETVFKINLSNNEIESSLIEVPVNYIYESSKTLRNGNLALVGTPKPEYGIGAALKDYEYRVAFMKF